MNRKKHYYVVFGTGFAIGPRIEKYGILWIPRNREVGTLYPDYESARQAVRRTERYFHHAEMLKIKRVTLRNK
jgi:hypothetical protein